MLSGSDMVELEKGMVQIYYGDGKGKTTAALGTALRACGQGLKVHLVQFIKNGTGDKEFEVSGEIKALSRLENFSHKRFGIGKWVTKDCIEEHKKEAEAALDYLQDILPEYDLVIADEVLYAVQLGLLDDEEVVKVIKSKPKNTEIILTGSHKPVPRVIAFADLVTEIKKIKHPFDRGVNARKGIDY